MNILLRIYWYFSLLTYGITVAGTLLFLYTVAIDIFLAGRTITTIIIGFNGETISLVLLMALQLLMLGLIIRNFANPGWKYPSLPVAFFFIYAAIILLNISGSLHFGFYRSGYFWTS